MLSLSNWHFNKRIRIEPQQNLQFKQKITLTKIEL